MEGKNCNKEWYNASVSSSKSNNEVFKKPVYYEFVKRAFDIVSSVLVLIILCWLFFIISIIVKTTSKGSVFFRDQRVGKNGKCIYILKFRTMYTDAEKNIHQYLSEKQYREWRTERKVGSDPRITSVGKFLRRTSLDELPQFICILKGDMSVVGPRPLAIFELEENYTPIEQKKLLSCKPGLTGIWATHGRSEISYASGERQQMELEYVDNRSIIFDLKLILGTVAAVLTENGAQ